MIEARNLRVGTGELDLVVRIDNARVAVEVKTVSGNADPLDAFDHAKRHQVSELAMDARCDRIDLIGIRVSEALAEVRWLPAID